MFSQFYNGSQQGFGKNRVQYFEFDWRSQNYERFKIHFYRGCEEFSEYTSKTIQKELLEMEATFNFQVKDKIEVLIFKSLTELRQSNIGLTNENKAAYGGKNQVVGSKLLIYYEDSHIALNQQIKRVLAETIMRKMLYGSQWSDILIGNDPNKHPEWFTGGFVDYLSQEWDADFESKIKDGFLTGKFDDFTRLDAGDARNSGRAFWHYIHEMYGRNKLMSLLYITKNVGHIDRSLLYLLGSNLNDLLPEFSNYYKKRFISDVKWQEEITGKELKVRMKDQERITHFAVSPKGNYLAYVTNWEGRYRLFVKETDEGKAKKLIANEPKLLRIQDASFPNLTFHPLGKYLGYFMERKGQMLFCLYDFEDKSTVVKEVPRLEKVISCDYSKDGKYIALVGVKNGQTDLFLYSISAGNSLSQLTDDIWDEQTPKWTNDNQGILFASNRITNEPERKKKIENFDRKYDLFMFPVKDKDKRKLKFERITETPDVNEKEPIELKNGNISYLSDVNGLWNQWELKKDSTISFIDTIIHYRPNNKRIATSNWNTGIIHHDIRVRSDEVYSLIFQNNQYKLMKDALNHDEKESNETYFKARIGKKLFEDEEIEAPVIETVAEEDSTHQTITISEDGKYESHSLVLYEDSTSTYKGDLEVLDPLEYERATAKRYKLNFAKDYVSAKIDNSFLSQSYQVYGDPGSVYLNPSLSGMLNISFSDLMEDIVMIGGLRIPTSRNNSEFFAGIDFRKKRLDKQLYYYRRSYESRASGDLQKIITHEMQLNFVYPFSEVFSLRGSVLSRTDISHPLAINESTLLHEINYNYQAGLKTSLVFDNARRWSENCWTGTRMKVFAEFLQSTTDKKVGMINLGFDVRHSIPLRKELIWVNRFAAGTSLGGKRLLYYMGGVDDWLLRPSEDFNNEIPVDASENFAYQTLATPMRGFVQNQRNGNSFAVFNSELRIPLFLLFTKGAVKNEPLRSFQLVGFFDLGTAWVGASPFSSENTFNENVIVNKPVVIKIENSREPIIAGTGIGIRTKIFGYFVRGDLGWGIENFSIRKKPLLFLSLTHDI